MTPEEMTRRFENWGKALVGLAQQIEAEATRAQVPGQREELRAIAQAARRESAEIRLMALEVSAPGREYECPLCNAAATYTETRDGLAWFKCVGGWHHDFQLSLSEAEMIRLATHRSIRKAAESALEGAEGAAVGQ